MKRKCSRNVAHSLGPLVLAWLFWTTEIGDASPPHPPTRQLSNLNHVFSTKVQLSTCRYTAKGKTVLSVHTLCFITFFGLCVCDLQVAVPGSELLPAHDLPLQISQRDVRAVKKHRVVAEFRGEFIMNMSHAETEKNKVVLHCQESNGGQFLCADRKPVSR